MYKYLGSHPEVQASLRKEVQYFTRYFDKGEDWYRAHFLSRPGRRVRFEATPDYLVFPAVPERAARLLPEVRILVLLRDPLVRVISHFRHMKRLGFENRSFVRPSTTSSATGMHGRSAWAECLGAGAFDAEIARHAYLWRSRYTEQLERWLEQFPASQFFVQESESFYRDTETAVAELARWIGIDPAGFRGLTTNYSYADPSAVASAAPAATEIPDAAMEVLVEDLARLPKLLADMQGAGAIVSNIPSWTFPRD